MPLKRRGEAMVRGASVAPGRRHVVVTLAGVEYAIEAGRVRHSLPVRDQPEVDVFFLNRSHPIVDLRALFGLPPFRGTQRSILVVEGDHGTAAILVDDVVGLGPIEAGAIAPLPAAFGGPERGWFEGLARAGDRVLVVIRVDGVVAAGHPGNGLPAGPAMSAVG